MSDDAPITVLHKSRLLAIVFRVGFLIFLAYGISNWFSRNSFYLFPMAAAGIFGLYFLFLEIQTVSFHDSYLSINYLLRKRRIVHGDIDYVSFEERQSWNSTIGSHRSAFVSMRLKNGRTIRLSGFQEGDQILYQQIKACESTNAEFLRRR